MQLTHSKRPVFGTLALATAILAFGPAGVRQAEAQPSVEAPGAGARAFDFAIERAALDDVLLSISRTSGTIISFQQDLVQGLTSGPIQGALTTPEALHSALRGSGLEALPSGDGGWTLQRAPVPAAAVAPAVQSVGNPATRAGVPGDVALEKVTVTGSRIPRAQVEGPSPVNVITSEEIAARGYRNVYDALASQTQNTGMTQGEDYGNTFQPAASALNLRGLGPNHTLVLVNGRRIADYPTAYGGTVNFTNLANIPSMMIERIEILSSGASAVYGSDAIAGVVNIILKDKTQGVDVNVRGGYTQRGGGDNQRVQITGGDTWGDFDGIFGLELSQRQPIWANQRSFMQDGPVTNVGYRRNLDTGNYLGPDCSAYGGVYGGKLENANGRCTTHQYYNDYWTVQAQKENYDGYTRGTWHFSDTGKAFADLMFGFDHTQNNTRGPSFTSPDFINQDTGDLERWYRSFASEEIGGKTSNNSKWREVSWTGTLGIEDTFANSDWGYQLAANRSEYTSTRDTRYTPLSSIRDYFLGPQLGTQGGYPVFAPDPSRLDTPLTPEQWRQFRGSLTQRSKSVSQTFSAGINGDLFDLPAGPVGFAGIAEVGRQSYHIDVDDHLNDGTFYNTTPGSNSGGSRDRYAVGGELSIPLTDTLLASAAGRWDQYKFSGRTEQQNTYNLGLEWRPVNSLLIRGSYGTSFRAPDLNYLYQADTNGYYPDQIDYYGCAKGVEGACDRGRVDYTQSGTPDLQSERGKSWTYGFVWSPSNQFDFSADFWRVEITDLLTTVDANRLLQQENQCRNGQLDAATCEDVLARVQRNASDAAVDPNRLQRVQVNAINAASERVSGLDLKSNIRWGAGQYGAFSSQLGYSAVLSHYYKESEGADTQNLRSSNSNYDWRSKVNASITWDYDRLSATLAGIRYGSVTNAAGDGRLSPWTTFNASARYQVSKKASVGVTVNNLLNRIKKDDSAGWPYYPTGNYDPYGRQVWLDVSYHFGS